MDGCLCLLLFWWTALLREKEKVVLRDLLCDARVALCNYCMVVAYHNKSMWKPAMLGMREHYYRVKEHSIEFGG